MIKQCDARRFISSLSFLLRTDLVICNRLFTALSSFTTQKHNFILWLLFLSVHLIWNSRASRKFSRCKRSFSAFQLKLCNTDIQAFTTSNYHHVMNYNFLMRPGFEVLILEAPCFTNEQKLF